MPELDTPMHLTMLNDARRRGDIERDGLYGLTWGDPQTNPALRAVRDRFVLPYVHPDRTAIEIGPGGGRWTRYLLGFGRLYAVDYHQALLDELARSFRAPCLRLLKNGGTDFPGIDDARSTTLSRSAASSISTCRSSRAICASCTASCARTAAARSSSMPTRRRRRGGSMAPASPIRRRRSCWRWSRARGIQCSRTIGRRCGIPASSGLVRRLSARAACEPEARRAPP